MRSTRTASKVMPVRRAGRGRIGSGGRNVDPRGVDLGLRLTYA
jgi:hypothetical protein